MRAKLHHDVWAQELATELRLARFATNALRLRNRAELVERIADLTRQHPTQYWVDGLDAARLPCGPVNTIDRVLEDPQVLHREMRI